MLGERVVTEPTPSPFAECSSNVGSSPTDIPTNVILPALFLASTNNSPNRLSVVRSKLVAKAVRVPSVGDGSGREAALCLAVIAEDCAAGRVGDLEVRSDQSRSKTIGANVASSQGDAGASRASSCGGGETRAYGWQPNTSDAVEMQTQIENGRTQKSTSRPPPPDAPPTS